MTYNGYENQAAFHAAIARDWQDPESDYQKYLYAEAMERHAKGLPLSWDYIAAPMPAGVVSAGSHREVYGDILGGSGE